MPYLHHVHDITAPYTPSMMFSSYVVLVSRLFGSNPLGHFTVLGTVSTATLEPLVKITSIIPD